MKISGIDTSEVIKSFGGFVLSRWKKDDVTDGAKYIRKWAITDAGQAYRKRQAEYAKEWRKNNREKYKASQKAAYYRARLEALQHYSGLLVPECRCCEENTFEFLTIDHVNNDGAAHRREIGMTQGDPNQMEKEGRKSSMGGNGFVYWLKKNGWPEGFQVLCWNCNGVKREGRECPHTIARRGHPDQLSMF